MSGQAESASASTARQIEATGPAAVTTVQAIQATAVGKPPPGGALTRDQQQAGPSSTQHDPPKSVPSQDAQKPGTSSQTVLEDEPQSSEGEPPLSVLWAAVSCFDPSPQRTSQEIYSNKHTCTSRNPMTNAKCMQCAQDSATAGAVHFAWKITCQRLVVVDCGAYGMLLASRSSR